MADCDKSAKTDKEKADCYSEVVKKDDGLHVMILFYDNLGARASRPRSRI